MSPETRYEHNLKVLRRRDPTITSIFDQFSHVCVYHHNGEKWEKHGYEGSMFLFERNAFPPYGFYILNRMGMEDYVQRLYPEDDIGAHGSYLMLRSYPEFTKRRLEELPKGHDKFSDVYKFDKEAFKPQQKGETQIIGLWMFATDAREPMIDVMIRCVLPTFLSELSMNILYSTVFTAISNEMFHTQMSTDMDQTGHPRLIPIYERPIMSLGGLPLLHLLPQQRHLPPLLMLTELAATWPCCLPNSPQLHRLRH